MAHSPRSEAGGSFRPGGTGTAPQHRRKTERGCGLCSDIYIRAAPSSSSAAAPESAFHAKVVEKIDALGGNGKDLDKNDFEQWMASCIPLYFVNGDNNQ